MQLKHYVRSKQKTMSIENFFQNQSDTYKAT